MDAPGMEECETFSASTDSLFLLQIPVELPAISIDIHSISMFWIQGFRTTLIRVMLLSMQLNLTLSSHWVSFWNLTQNFWEMIAIVIFMRMVIETSEGSL